MTKQKRTPIFHTLFNIVFQIPKNYSTSLGVMLFHTAYEQPLKTNQILSGIENSFLPQLNIQPILSNYTNKI